MQRTELLEKTAEALIEILNNGKTAASPQEAMTAVEAAKVLALIAQLMPLADLD